MSTRYAQFRELLNIMAEKAIAKGAEIYYETPAQQLVQDDSGAVTGVIAQRADGSYIRVNASKGVILATGDLSDDPEMLECFAPHVVGIHGMHSEHCNTGDGHKMGLWAGAAMDLPHRDGPWAGRLARVRAFAIGEGGEMERVEATGGEKSGGFDVG